MWFVLQLYGTRLDLHSFPTRRSSDLIYLVISPTESRLVRFDHTKRTRLDRSEEHTSELQSRRDLVCRLLLEKKKNVGNPSSSCGTRSGGDTSSCGSEVSCGAASTGGA